MLDLPSAVSPEGLVMPVVVAPLPPTTTGYFLPTLRVGSEPRRGLRRRCLLALSLAACFLCHRAIPAPAAAAPRSTLSRSTADSAAAPVLPTWDCASDTWVATDALGRSLPGYTQARSEERRVGTES